MAADGLIPLTDVNTYLEEARGAEDNLIGLKVFPPAGQPTQTGRYLKWRIAGAELLKANAPVHAPGSAFPRVNRRWDFDSYATVERGLEELIPIPTEEYISKFGFPLRARTAAWVQRQQLLAHELRVESALFNTSNFTSTNASVAYTSTNIATLDFVNDVLAAKRRLEKKGVNPSEATIVMSSALWDLIRRSTIFQTYIRGNQPTDSKLIINVATAANLLGVKEILVGKASYDPTGTGAAYDPTKLQYIWPVTYFWIGKIEGGDFMAGGAGRTIFWSGLGPLFQAFGYPDFQRDSNIVRVKSHTVEKVIDPTCGELVQTSSDAT